MGLNGLTAPLPVVIEQLLSSRDVLGRHEAEEWLGVYLHQLGGHIGCRLAVVDQPAQPSALLGSIHTAGGGATEQGVWPLSRWCGYWTVGVATGQWVWLLGRGGTCNTSHQGSH